MVTPMVVVTVYTCIPLFIYTVSAAGELHVPLNVCGAVVKRELDWWQVDDSLIEPCCWIKYSKVSVKVAG